MTFTDQRYYTATAGRFYTPDPAGMGAVDLQNPTTWNMYAYSNDDPLNGYDPYGLWDCNPDTLCAPPGPPILFPGGGENAQSAADQAKTIPPVVQGALAQIAATLAAATRQVDGRLAVLRRDIDPHCLSWLESGIAGGSTTVFNQYYNALIGVGGGPPLAGAVNLGGSGPNAVTNNYANGFSIAINTSGAFFSSRVGVGYANKYDSQVGGLVGGTPAAQNFILLHELAHFFQASGFIQNDFDPNNPGSTTLQRQNNDLLWSNCNKTIQGIGPMN